MEVAFTGKASHKLQEPSSSAPPRIQADRTHFPRAGLGLQTLPQRIPRRSSASHEPVLLQPCSPGAIQEGLGGADRSWGSSREESPATGASGARCLTSRPTTERASGSPEARAHFLARAELELEIPTLLGAPTWRWAAPGEPLQTLTSRPQAGDCFRGEHLPVSELLQVVHAL